MKRLFTHLVLFIALSIVFSLLTACNKSDTTDNQGNTTANTNTSSEKPKVKYPPVTAAIMQAENKLLDDSILKLEDKKGKVVLVNLWATWCGPCRGEMPHLVELQEKYKDKGFEIIGLDTDPESKEAIEKFAKDMKLNYTLGWANETLANEMVKITRLNGIPQSILINREGQLTGVFTGGSMKVVDKLKETVERIVNE